MATRLILSLKKTANSPSAVWSAGQVSGIKFARRSIGGAVPGGDVSLTTFVGGTRSVSEL